MTNLIANREGWAIIILALIAEVIHLIKVLA